MDHTCVIMYASDTELHCSGDDLQLDQDDLQSDLNQIQTWLQANRLHLNVSKTVGIQAETTRSLCIDLPQW